MTSKWVIEGDWFFCYYVDGERAAQISVNDLGYYVVENLLVDVDGLLVADINTFSKIEEAKLHAEKSVELLLV